MDLDVFVAAHRAEWDRLEVLLRQGRALTGPEADELVALYQRVNTHLSVVRSSTPDPALVGRLSSLVARARSTITGTHTPAWREVGIFFLRRLPAAFYRARWWWLSTAAAFLAIGTLVGRWVAATPRVQATIAAPEEIRDLTRPGGEFETYYSSEPAASFAGEVWTNNVQVSILALFAGVLIIPTVVVLLINAVAVGINGGLMAAAGRLDIFFGLITPHGLLEITAVFVAGGAGLRLGWTWIDPGDRGRAEALAREGRAAGAIVLGLALILLITGVIEAFVTPSGLSTAARVSVGIAAELLFLAYVFVLGRRAVNAGETGDIL